MSGTKAMQHWLMKSEPDVYGVDDLAREPGRKDYWEGIRNYQARNFMHDMKRGDRALFYHSSCAEPAVVGIMEIAREAYPDFTAFDARAEYYDPKSDPDDPRWFMVDVRLVKKLRSPVTLKQMRERPELADMRLLQRGNRLSIMPVNAEHYRAIMKMAGEK